MVAQIYTANRTNLRSWFDRELAALPAEPRERTLNALAMALAPESWVVLRQRLGLSVEQARDELRFVVARRLHRRRGPPLAAGAGRRASSSRARSRKPELAQMGDRVAHIVEVGAGGAACRGAPAPRPSASGSLPANWRCRRSAR